MTIDANKAIISLPDAKGYLKVQGPDDDAIIEDLINSCSDMITGFLNREVVAISRTGYYSGDGSKDLILRQPNIVSVTSVHVDNDRAFGVATLIDPSDYIVMKDPGIIYAGGNAGISPIFGYWSPGKANIKVVYTAGYTTATMPHALKLACKRLVDYHYRTGYTHRKIDTSSESVGGMNVSYRDNGIPRDVIEMLVPYRRMMTSPQHEYDA